MADRVRIIHSDYWLGEKKLQKRTYSSHAANAVPNAVRHLQWNDYKADRVEVYDTRNGALIIVIRARLKGASDPQLEVIYKRSGIRAIIDEKPEE